MSAVSRSVSVQSNVTYTIVAGNDAGLFAVSPRTGVVSVAAALDFEELQAHNLSIQATDATWPLRSAAGTVIITVTDVNDNDPVFAAGAPASIRLADNAVVGTELGQFFARDADAGLNAVLQYAATSTSS